MFRLIPNACGTAQYVANLMRGYGRKTSIPPALCEKNAVANHYARARRHTTPPRRRSTDGSGRGGGTWLKRLEYDYAFCSSPDMSVTCHARGRSDALSLTVRQRLVRCRSRVPGSVLLLTPYSLRQAGHGTRHGSLEVRFAPYSFYSLRQAGAGQIPFPKAECRASTGTAVRALYFTGIANPVSRTLQPFKLDKSQTNVSSFPRPSSPTLRTCRRRARASTPHVTQRVDP